MSEQHSRKLPSCSTYERHSASGRVMRGGARSQCQVRGRAARATHPIGGVLAVGLVALDAPAPATVTSTDSAAALLTARRITKGLRSLS